MSWPRPNFERIHNVHLFPHSTLTEAETDENEFEETNPDLIVEIENEEPSQDYFINPFLRPAICSICIGLFIVITGAWLYEMNTVIVKV